MANVSVSDVFHLLPMGHISQSQNKVPGTSLFGTSFFETLLFMPQIHNVCSDMAEIFISLSSLITRANLMQ
jgi:hypothetical protein